MRANLYRMGQVVSLLFVALFWASVAGAAPPHYYKCIGDKSKAWGSCPEGCPTIKFQVKKGAEVKATHTGSPWTWTWQEGWGTGDFEAQCSCDGGTTWKTAATYTVVKVTFQEDTSQLHGFDDYTSSTLPWKSILKNQSDTAKADTTPDAAKDAVYLKSTNTGKATVSPTHVTADPQTVTIAGVDKGTCNVQANLNTVNGCTAGTLRVAVYENQNKTVCVRLIHEENDDTQPIQPGNGKSEVSCVGWGPDHAWQTFAEPDDTGHWGGWIDTGGNGICNTTKNNLDPTGDDVYLNGITPGCGLANQVCVSAGANGKLDTNPNGASDDAVAGETVTTGADGVCNTTANNTNVNSTDVATQDIIDYLAKAYKQACTTWAVTRLDAVAVNFDLDRDGTLDVGGNFPTTEQAAIINAAKDDDYDANIFLVDNPSQAWAGETAINQRYAFVHGDVSANPGRTCAHELGHATFGLEDITVGDTENLMWQVEGDKWRLRKAQWDSINP